MHVGQILLPGASAYEKKSQRIDFAILSELESVRLWPELPSGSSALAAQLRESGVDLAHVYGDPSTHARIFRRLPVPYLSSTAPARGKFRLGRLESAALVAGPLSDPALPEAVEEAWFANKGPLLTIGRKERYVIASHGPKRPGVSTLVGKTMSRLDRFRQDIEWIMFDQPPSPGQLASIDLWVDPAFADDDLDGFTAEALVAGRRVVACRTPINQKRLAGGSGFLVPVNDPNELAHAIVTALFKDEIVVTRLEVAFAESYRFRPSARASELLRLYNRILHE